jgi:hypothetical protein
MENSLIIDGLDSWLLFDSEFPIFPLFLARSPLHRKEARPSSAQRSYVGVGWGVENNGRKVNYKQTYFYTQGQPLVRFYPPLKYNPVSFFQILNFIFAFTYVSFTGMSKKKRRPIGPESIE